MAETPSCSADALQEGGPTGATPPSLSATASAQYVAQGILTTAAVTTVTAIVTETGKTDAGNATKSIETAQTGNVEKSVPHGNSRESNKPQHRYELVENSTEDVVKTGISGGALNKDDSSRRANSQVNKLNKAEGEGTYSGRVMEKKIPGRKEALDAEKKATNNLSKQGNTLRLQKRPKR